jgi:hypothetical protein
MQRAEIDREQEQFTREIKELKAEIATLTKRRDELGQEHLRASPLMQKLSRYVGFGAGGKLEWISFKLKFKQEQLAGLVLHPEEERNGVAKLLNLVPSAPAAPARETLPEKMERMVTENPPQLEPHIRRVYQSLIAAKTQRER